MSKKFHRKKTNVFGITIAILLVAVIASSVLAYFFNSKFQSKVKEILKFEQTTPDNSVEVKQTDVKDSEEYLSLKTKYDEKSQELENKNRELEKVKSEKNSLENQLSGLNKNIDKLQAEKIDLENQLTTATGDKTELENQLAAKIQELETAISEKETLQNELDLKNEKLDGLTMPVYSFSVQDLSSEDYGSGKYLLMNSLDSDTYLNLSSDTKEDSVEYFTDEYIFIYPNVAGNYVSNIYFIYETDEKHTVSFTLAYDADGYTLNENKTVYPGVEGVFDSIELFSNEYGSNYYVFQDNNFNARVSVPLSDSVSGCTILCLKVSKVKKSLKFACEYSTQQYNVAVKQRVRAGGFILEDNSDVANCVVDYAKSAFYNLFYKYEKSLFGSPTWYLNEIKAGNEISENNRLKNVNKDCVLIADYDLQDKYEIKKIINYSWDNDNSCYSISKTLVLQDVIFTKNILDCSYEYELAGVYGYEDLDDSTKTNWDTNTSFHYAKIYFDDDTFVLFSDLPVTNSYKKIKRIEISSVDIKYELVHNNMNNRNYVGTAIFDSDRLVSLINSVIDNEDEKYDIFNIDEFFEEGVYFESVSSDDNVIIVRLSGNEESKFFGKTIILDQNEFYSRLKDNNCSIDSIYYGVDIYA